MSEPKDNPIVVPAGVAGPDGNVRQYPLYADVIAILFRDRWPRFEMEPDPPPMTEMQLMEARLHDLNRRVSELEAERGVAW